MGVVGIIRNLVFKYRVIISGGGTGGHIFPAISIANTLRSRFPECEILFVGAEDRMEMEKVPAAGYEIKGLPVCGFNRSSLFKNIRVLKQLFVSLGQAKNIINEFKPDIVKVLWEVMHLAYTTFLIGLSFIRKKQFEK